VETSARHAKIL
jgi:hypothetical protein